MATNNTTQATNRRFTRRGFLRTTGTGLAGAFVGGFGTSRFLNSWYGNQMTAPSVPREGVAAAPLTVTTSSGMKVHHIQTGFVAVKRAHRSYDGRDGSGILAIVGDPNWTEWMPITVWVIEHPEGVILVDTGEVPEVNDPDYFACDPMSGFVYNSFLRFSVTREEVIDHQLNRLGINMNEVRWIVQTHLHGDHVHGLKFFPQAEVFTSALDYPTSQGFTRCLYPDGQETTLVTFNEDDIAGFRSSYSVTQAGDVIIVPTPGHSEGHQSVILRDGDVHYFFAGDTSFDEAQMLTDGIAGIAISPVSSRETTANIRAYAQANPTIYLPSHDPETRDRLENQQFVVVS